MGGRDPVSARGGGCARRRRGGNGVFWNRLFSGPISRSGMWGKREWPRGQVLRFPLPRCAEVGPGCSQAGLMLIRIGRTGTKLRRPLLPVDIKGWHRMRVAFSKVSRSSAESESSFTGICKSSQLYLACSLKTAKLLSQEE